MASLACSAPGRIEPREVTPAGRLQAKLRGETGRAPTIRRVGLRSTTTERSAPPRLVNATVALLLRGAGVFWRAVLTCSGSSSIKPAAISTCASTSSVSPRAAKIASSRVGGSCFTRRGPYFVFQVVLIFKILKFRTSLASRYRDAITNMVRCTLNARTLTFVGESPARRVALPQFDGAIGENRIAP